MSTPNSTSISESVETTPHLTYHQWRGEPRDQESPPTDNDTWECLLRTNANLGREVSELKKQRDVLSSQLQSVITACHLRGYNVGEPLGDWLEKQFKEAETNLTELLLTKAARKLGALAGQQTAEGGAQ